MSCYEPEIIVLSDSDSDSDSDPDLEPDPGPDGEPSKNKDASQSTRTLQKDVRGHDTEEPFHVWRERMRQPQLSRPQGQPSKNPSTQQSIPQGEPSENPSAPPSTPEKLLTEEPTPPPPSISQRQPSEQPTSPPSIPQIQPLEYSPPSSSIPQKQPSIPQRQLTEKPTPPPSIPQKQLTEKSPTPPSIPQRQLADKPSSPPSIPQRQPSIKPPRPPSIPQKQLAEQPTPPPPSIPQKKTSKKPPPPSVPQKQPSIKPPPPSVPQRRPSIKSPKPPPIPQRQRTQKPPRAPSVPPRQPSLKPPRAPSIPRRQPSVKPPRAPPIPQAQLKENPPLPPLPPLPPHSFPNDTTVRNLLPVRAPRPTLSVASKPRSLSARSTPNRSPKPPSKSSKKSSRKPRSDKQSKPPTSQSRPSTSPSRPSAPQNRPSTSQRKLSTSQSKPSTSQSKPSTSQSKPSTSRSRPSTSQNRPSTSQSGPSTSQSSPSTSQSDPSTSQSSPSTSQSDPSTSQSDPSTSQSRSLSPHRKPSDPPTAPPNPRNRQTDGVSREIAELISRLRPIIANLLYCSNCVRSNLKCDRKTPACSLCKEKDVACSYQSPLNPTGKSRTLVLWTDTTYSIQNAISETTKRMNLGKERPQSGSIQNELNKDKRSGTRTPDVDQGGPLKLVFRPQAPQRSDVEQPVHTDQQSQEFIETDDEVEEIVEEPSSISREDQEIDCVSVSSESSVHSIEEAIIRPTVKSFTKLLKSLRKELRDWQQITVQADLRQATLDASKRSGPEIDTSLPDPFKELTEERRSKYDPSSNSDILETPATWFSTGSTILPKYKSIGRVNSSFLAPNYRTATHRAYDADDENEDPDSSRKYEEFEQRYKTDFVGLAKQRVCQELIWLWEPWVEEAFRRVHIQKSDVLYFFTQAHFDPGRRIEFGWSESTQTAWREEQKRSCRTCGLGDPESRQSNFGEDFKRLPRPDDRSLVSAGLAARAFHELTGSSLWHIALGNIIQPRYRDSEAAMAQDPGLCLICFRHQCPDHGSYEEPSDEDQDMTSARAFINDEESDRNIRKFVSLPSAEPDLENKTHLCGIFCVDPSTNLRQILGRQPDGDISGESRPPENYIRPVLGDDQLCGSSCFWDVNNRRDLMVSEVKFLPFLSQSQKQLVEKLMGFYLYNQRGPCLISRVIKDVSCMQVFNHIIFSIFHVNHPTDPSPVVADSSPAQRGSSQAARRKKKSVPVIDVSRSAELDTRPPFFPCSHEGPCHNNPACSCAGSKVHCEWFCGCDDSCKRRFRGCTCKAGGNKVCFQDYRCECWKFNRECDPHLCGRCGVFDVLDSFNKYRVEIRKGRCRNNRIQLGVPVKTTKAPSQVQGYGLYTLVDIPSGDFIGEYVGEVISKKEGDRRGALYHLQNQEYLFALNATQEIDASNNGNKMRFMNNSQKEEHINVEPKSLWCSGQVRIGLFARRRVRAGEELLWKYGYDEDQVMNFWEPGEKESSDRAQIPFSQERAARSAGANKLAGEASEDAREDSSQSPVPPRRQKRKRSVSKSPEASSSADDKVAASSADEKTQSPEIGDSEDSNYETDSDRSDDGDLDEDKLDEEFGLDRVVELSRRRSGLEDGLQRGRPKVQQHKRAAESHDDNGDNNPKSKGTNNGASGRRRKSGAQDRRYGGVAQQQAWETRRQKAQESSSSSK